MRGSSALQELFQRQRAALSEQLAQRLVRQMTVMLEQRPDSADLLLVAADGRRLPAHLCLLRQRAPVFFGRYVEPTLKAAARAATPQRPLEVAVGDVDSQGLHFFVRSIYTDEELSQLPCSAAPCSAAPSAAAPSSAAPPAGTFAL